MGRALKHDRPVALRVTPMQRGMLAESLLARGRMVNIEQVVCELEDPLDPERFRAAWQSALDRFDALRLEFEWPKPDEPLVRVCPRVDLPFRLEDWTKHSEAEQREMLASFFDRDRSEGIDLFRAPLMRVSVFRLSDTRWCFVWTVRHCLIDGGSYASVLEYVLSTYQGDLQPVGPAPSYFDFIRWAAERDTQAGVEHFRRLLEGFSEPTELPLRNDSRIASRDSHVVEHRRRLDVPTSRGLKKLADECGASLNTVTQLVWGVLLSRYAGRDDVVFGTTWSGRTGTIEGAKQTVGLFIATVPIRLDLSGDPSIKEALRSLRQQHLEGRPFQQTPLHQIKAATGASSKKELFRTLTVFEPGRLSGRLSDLSERWKTRKVWSRSHTNYPLCLYTFMEAGALIVQLERDSGLYSAAEAEQILRHYVSLLSEVACNPDAQLHDLRVLDRGVYERLTAAEAEREQEPPEISALQRILDQAHARGAHTAIEAMDGRSMTYAELASRIRSTAHALQARGVREGDLLALLLPRSIEAVVAMLAAHYLHAAFMLADPDYPPERIAFMLDDSKARFILVNGASSSMPRTSATVVDLEQLSPEVPPPSSAPPAVAPDSLAYVVYTSGSTGIPKGVCLTHGALSHHAMTTVDVFRLTPKDRVLQFAALSFDVSLEEIFPTLCAGATLVLRNRELAQTSRSFFAAAEQHRLTVLNLPTAFWHKLTDSRAQATWPRCVRLLVVGGEQASVEAHERFREARTDWIRWINAYGPTETTITSTFYDDRQSDPDPAMPIGRPHRGVSHFVLDHHMRPVPQGVVGQLYIGGCTLALGYLGQKEKTAERFVPHPWREGARLYATGDLVRQTSAGNYVYVDRVDQQVKVRGFRIELGEVEAHLLSCPGVSEAAVVVRRDRGGDAALIGFVVGDRNLVDLPRIRECLSRALPSHMVPKRILTLDELPQTPAGKIDREALSAARLSEDAQLGDQLSAPPNEPIQTELAEIWTGLLGKPISDASINFFQAGGHSLLVVQLFNEVESRLNRSCDAQAFFRDPTLEGLARLVRQGIEVERQEPIVQLAPGDPAVRPLFLAPGVTGLALDYVHLAEALDSMIPVYGFRTPGLTDVEVAGDSLNTMAQTYAKLILKAQPEGPHALAGYSTGGIVALAIAEQLLEIGHEVDFFAVLDGTPPASIPVPSPFTSPKRLWRLARTTAARLREIGENRGSIEASAGRVLEAALRAPARWFGRHYRHDIGGLFRHAQVDFSKDDLSSMQAQLDLIMQYRPKTIPAKLVLFRTELDPFEGPHEPDLGWGRLVRDGVRIEWLAGRHHEVLAPSGASLLAAAITPYLLHRAANPRSAVSRQSPGDPGYQTASEASLDRSD